MSFPGRSILIYTLLFLFGSSIAFAQSRDFAFLGVFTEAIDKTKTDSGLRIIYRCFCCSVIGIVYFSNRLIRGARADDFFRRSI